jgi:hypothetical protein
MRPEAKCALALSIALFTVAGCGSGSSSNAVAATPQDPPPAAPTTPMGPGTMTSMAGPQPTLDDFERSWTVDRTVGDPFTCHEDEPEPCHLGHSTDEPDDGSEWSIRLKERTVRNPADCNNDGALRQFDLTVYKSTPVSGDAPNTTTVGFGILCELASTPEVDIAGAPKFRHAGGFEPHSVRMTLLKKNSGTKPFRVKVDMQNKVHIHNGTGHGED